MFTLKYKNMINSALMNLKSVNTNENCKLNVACEVLTRIILAIYKQGPNVSYPEEGNTMKEFVRVYKSEEHSQ